MEDPGRRWRRVGLAGAVAVVLALTVPNVASGSLTGGDSSIPPANTCIIPFLPCYILLSIDSGSPGNKETVTGAQFYPDEPYTVYFWNGTSGAPALDVASGSTGTGSFSASFRIPKDPVGGYTIFVTDFAGDNQSAQFQLTHMHASPNSGPVASTILVSGQGFLPDHIMKFHIHGTRAATTARCQTNRYGNFSGCRVTVPNVPTGETQLIATDGTYTARVEFVVS